LISIPYLVISSLLTLEEKTQALRSDVLHIIGVGLLAVMLVYYLATRFSPKNKKKIMGVTYFSFLLVAVGLYPLLNKVDFSNLPLFISAYLNNYGTKSMFTLAAWLAYIFAGGLMGIWLDYEVKKGFTEFKIGVKLLLAGFTLTTLAELGNRFEIY